MNTLRLALWSGPRNISTAMMRSWGNRPDTFVCDEPLYAHYLAATGLDHPEAGAVIAAGETAWRKVVDWLTSPVPEGKAIFYQKHMTHHLLPDMKGGWLDALTHCFLIRDPREVITSYLKKSHDPTLEDLGFVQQVELFNWARAEQRDSARFRRARRAELSRTPPAPLVRQTRRGLHARHALMGTWPALDGRHLGKTLVHGGQDIDLLSPLSAQSRPGSRASARRLRRMPGGL